MSARERMPRRAKAPTAAKPPGGPSFARVDRFDLLFVLCDGDPTLHLETHPGLHICSESHFQSRRQTQRPTFMARDETSFSKSQRVLGDSGGPDRHGSSDDWNAGEIRRDAAFPSKPLISAVLGHPDAES